MIPPRIFTLSTFPLTALAALAVLLLPIGPLAHATGGDSEAQNLLSLNLTEGQQGNLPPSFKITNLKEKESQSGTVKLDFTDSPVASEPSIRFELPQDGSLFLSTSMPIQLEARKYRLSFKVKVDEMIPAGPSMTSAGVQRGVVVYVAPSEGGNLNNWVGIVGEGSTGGWVTATLCFDASSAPGLDKVNIWLRCIDLKGSVSFRDLRLVELPESAPIESHFTLENGHVTSGGLMKLGQ